MAQALIGQAAPEFTLLASNGKKVSLKDYRGKKLVIFFYPTDSTPTCTNEACDFRDFNGKFAKLGAKVIGISPDNLKSHDKFIAENDLPFLLLSDPEHKVAEQFGVWGLKKLYGREYMGIVRSTFLIDGDGKVAKEWRNLRVKNHVQNVLDAVKALG
jgi:peroxiredoxin Q/BCP